MAHTHLLALCDMTGDHTPSLVLIFPDRVDAPGLDATAMAVALASTFGQAQSTFGKARAQNPTFATIALRDRSGHAVHTPWARFAAGSWMALPTDSWTGVCDTQIVVQDDRVEGLAESQPRPSAFFQPSLAGHGAQQTLARPDLWRDSAPAAVAMGVLDALGTVPFGEDSFDARLNPSWLTGLMVSCAQALVPWQGDKAIPLKGYGSRPFPSQASVHATEKALVGWFAAPDTDAPEAETSHNRGQGFVQHLVRAGLVMANAPHSPTAWVLGPAWGRFLQAFPEDLLDAGRACAGVVGAFAPWTAEDILSEAPEGSSAHQRAARLAPFARMEHILSGLPAHRLRPGFAKRAGVVRRLRGEHA
jgi:hypothetical protein